MKFQNPHCPTKDELERLAERVGGSLYLEGTGITSLPDGLSVGGWLDLRGTSITSLPDSLSVGGLLYLEGTPIPAIYNDTERGYKLRRVRVGAQGEWFVAGCRKFENRAAALAHWGGVRYPDKARGQHYCDAINAQPEGWL